MNRALRFASTIAVGAGLAVGVAMAAAAYAAKQVGLPPVSGLEHYRVFCLAALTLILLIPALSLFVLQRRMAPGRMAGALDARVCCAPGAHLPGDRGDDGRRRRGGVPAP